MSIAVLRETSPEKNRNIVLHHKEYTVNIDSIYDYMNGPGMLCKTF